MLNRQNHRYVFICTHSFLDVASLSQPLQLISGTKNECIHEKIQLELLENFLWDTNFQLYVFILAKYCFGFH